MGKKNLCPVPSTEGYLEASKDTFQDMYDKIVEKHPNLKQGSAVINALYNEILDMDSVLADAFAAWTKNTFPNHIYNTAIDVRFKDVTEEEVEASLFIKDNVMSSYNDINDIFEPHLDQEFKEGEHEDYSQNEMQASKIVNVKKEGDNHFKNRFFKSIGKPVSKKEYAEIIKATREKSFDELLDFLIEKYPDIAIAEETGENQLLATIFGEVALDKVKDPKKLQALKNFHIFNQSQNRLTKKQKKFYIITNWDGKEVFPKGTDILQERGDVDLKTKRDLAQYLTASFIDVSKNVVMGGTPVSNTVAYMSLNDMVEIVKTDDGWYAKDVKKEYNKTRVNNWLKVLIEQKQMTIASLKGGNSGTIILTKVLPQYYNQIINPEQVKVLAPKLNPKFVKWLNNDKNKGNLLKALKSWQKYLYKKINSEGIKNYTEEAAIYNDVLDLHNKLSIVGFKKYIDKELEIGNINEDKQKEFMKNIFDLPVKGTVNEITGMKEPYIFMGDYLASIVARHEFLKATRGNTYSIRQTLEDLFNRMRLTASEGINVLEGVTDKQAIIVDQKNVYYKNSITGERIEPSEQLEGMKNKVDIDDGQLHIDSQMIDELSTELGRRKVFDWEHNPKEVKIVQYNLEQTPEGQEDNYIETKQMAFLAEPGFEVVDSKTDKVLAKVVKEEDSIVIYAGPATNIAGQRINQIMTLNEAKNMTGTYAFKGSHNIVTIPKEGIRTIILPSTKSHSDSAMGTTWANAFNINEPIYNTIRRKIINFYKSISNDHINIFHKVISDPEYAKKFFKYQTTVRDDATNEIQELFKMSPDGIHHLNNWKIVRRSLFNTLVLNGALMGRISIDRTNPRKMSYGASTSLKIKQDIMGRIKLNDEGEPEGFYVGIGNDRLLNYVGDMYLEQLENKIIADQRVESGGQLRNTMTRQDLKTEVDLQKNKFRDSTPEEKVEILNDFLKNNEVLGYGVRQPVQHVGGAIFRRILGFLPDVGDSLVAHVKDVAVQWIGDGDGDTVNIVIFGDQAFAKEIQGLLRSEALKNQQAATSDLDIFEHSEQTSAASYKGFVDTLTQTVKYANGQGIMTNLKTVASVLELKLGDSPITLTNGSVINVIKAKDFVVMDYAPLKQGITEKDLPDFASIVNQDGSEYDGTGPKYMRTTAQHERLLLLNAATDNTKEHLIGRKWNIDFDKVTELIFRKEGDEPLMPAELKLLKNLSNAFNYSKIRNGRHPITGNKMEDNEWYDYTKIINMFITGDSEYQLENLQERVKLKKNPLNIKEITISSEMTVDEMLLTNPIQKRENFTANDSESSSPARYSKNRYDNANDYAMLGFKTADSSLEITGLNNKINDMFKKRNIVVTQELKDAVRSFINKFDAAWRQQLETGQKGKARKLKEPTSQIYSYDEDMNDFLAPYRKELESLVEEHGEGFKMLVTYLQFKGFGEVKRQNLFYPHDFMDAQLYDLYMKTWTDIFFAKDPETKLNLMDSFQATPTAKRRVPDVVNPDENVCG